MTFTSFTFLIFLGIFFPVYWLAHADRRVQNSLVLVASYIFYAWWDWRFLGLILISSLVDYLMGLAISASRDPRHRRYFLAVSIVTNLGILGFFKYFNFFVDNAVLLLTSVGLEASPRTLSVILPVGISFYTLQSMGYTIDVYRRRVEACRDPVAFFAFVAFFPQLVAGPIERANNLLAQFSIQRRFSFDLANDGIRQIGWGFFKKIMIADNLGRSVEPIFAAPANYSSGELALASVFFGFQIYCDFSAYSDIAIGTGKLLGLRIRRNFNLPYFAVSLRDFWSRWHISLTTWLRDYLYIPLGGSRRSEVRTVINILAVFLISGLWHGAQWTFVAWGAVHGILVVAERLASRSPLGAAIRNASPLQNAFLLTAGWITTFVAVMAAWVFFRAASIGDAFFILGEVLSWSALISIPAAILASPLAFASIIVLVAVEWLQRDKEHPLQFERIPVPVQMAGYIAMVFFVVSYGAVDESPFIYFQF